MSELGGMTKDLEKGLEETVRTFDNLIDENVRGSYPGTRDIRGDAQFKLWFLTMLRDYGPNWVLALDYVEGGKEVLERWNRIVAAEVGNATTGI